MGPLIRGGSYTTPKPDALVKSVKALLAEREATTAKERELVRSLNGVLNKIGYQVVPLGRSATPGGRRRRRRTVPRADGKPGRPTRARARRRGRAPKRGQGG